MSGRARSDRRRAVARHRARGAARIALVGVLVGSWLLASEVMAAAPAAAEAQSPEPASWIVVDADTGEVIAAHNEHEARRPASTAKIMTALTAVERLPPDATIPVSELADAQPPSDLGISPGEEWPFEAALAAVLLESANDMSYALAEAVGAGDLDAWVEIVNATAERLGMDDSTFNDPSGLDAVGETLGDGPYASAHDIAIATRNAMAVPTLAALAGSLEYEYVWPGTDTPAVMTNHNKMLPGGERGYDGVTGFKTGFTEAAGHTFVGTAERDGRSLIVVILDTYDFYGWAAQLFDQGFATAPGAGTDVTLPDVEVEPYAERQADLLGFAAVALGPDDPAASPEALATGAEEEPGTFVTGGAAADVETDGQTDSATDGQPTDGLADEAAAGESETADDSGSSGGGIPVTAVIAGGFVLTLAAFFLRRRQITVRKRRRIAQRRRAALAMRRGTLLVADGRAPVAGRASSPAALYESESHVRIVPIEHSAPSVPPPPARRPSAVGTRRVASANGARRTARQRPTTRQGA
jgi:D-alanyl-D-alanine carboxypeptidase (penicillin-binding protein 5/6)